MTDSIAVQKARSTFGSDVSAQEIVSCSGNAFVTHVRLEGGRVNKVWSTGRMVRNMNVLLRGELDGQGRPRFVNQPHCLCNDGHALAAIRAVEDLAGVVLPHSAVLVRRIVQSLRCIQEHLLHFYQFHLSDWASLAAALAADAVETARLSTVPDEDADHFRMVRERLASLAKAHPAPMPEAAYRGAGELHLLLYGHALRAIRAGASLQTALGLLGCGPKGFSAYRLGGLSSDLDLDVPVIGRLRAALAECRDFVSSVFPGDVAHIARVYGPWAEKGRGHAFLTWDGAGPGSLIVPGADEASWRVLPSEGGAVREESEPDWCNEDRSCYRLSSDWNRPSFRWERDDFFWLSAPRHGRDACEVGSLARVLGGWLHGRDEVRQTMTAVLDDGGLSLEAMNSTMGRVLSRAIECAAGMRSVFGWLEELEGVWQAEDRHDADFVLPASGTGVGRVEVPRGSLAHTVCWDHGRIVNHEYLIPSLWNFSPRDSRGAPGPLESALAGASVADPYSPVEILRTLHQLDPCNTCHVMVEDRDTGRTSLITA
jgi:Ni,Fe-hydrogenase I large subunit